MTAMTLTKAKQALTTKIANRLSKSLKGSGALAAGSLAACGSASKDLVEGLLADRDSRAALAALLEAASVPLVDEGIDPWLKTEEAARKMGFSRPYVAALIDTGEFGAGAAKTAKGHRRVRASAIERWLRDHEVSTERRVQAEASDSLVEFFEAPKTSGKQAAKLAARIEQARREAMAHRPSRKRA